MRFENIWLKIIIRLLYIIPVSLSLIIILLLLVLTEVFVIFRIVWLASYELPVSWVLIC